MANRGAKISAELAALWQDDAFLAPLRPFSWRLVLATIALLIVVALSQRAIFIPSPLVFLVYLLGGIGAISLQFIGEERQFGLMYMLTVGAVALLMVAGAAVSALIVLGFVVFQTFIRCGLRTALMLAIIPTLLYALVVRTLLMETEVRGAPVAWLVGVGIYGFYLVGGMARRHQVITNHHLTWTHEQLDREMTRSAHLAVAQERTRIARDMHDLLAHSLTALSVQTQAARQTLATDPAKTAQMLEEMAVTLRQSMKESRDLVQVLREAAAPVTDTPSLRDALQTVADQFGERTRVQMTLTQTGQPQPLPDAMTSDLRHIAQEALTNAFRHGAARHITLSLMWQPDALEMRITDDGTPQPAPLSPGSGNGLRGMRERLSAWDGTLTAEPREGGGFVVDAHLPLGSVTR